MFSLFCGPFRFHHCEMQPRVPYILVIATVNLATVSRQPSGTGSRQKLGC